MGNLFCKPDTSESSTAHETRVVNPETVYPGDVDVAVGEAKPATTPAPFSSGSSPMEMTTHVALDSGTGETKVLKFCQGADGSVEVTEMAKLDSLKGLFVGAVDSAAVADLTREIQSAVKAASPSHCFAGLTSWFRTADQAERDAVEAFFRNSLPNFELLMLSGHEEALKESIAVTFAAEKSGIGKPDTQVAAGGGSMQLVQGSEVYSLEQGFREGQTELMGKQPRRVVCDALVARASARFAEFKDEHPRFAVTKGTVVGISAAYYAAKGAKIDCTKSVVASEAYELFKARKDELVANCSDDDANSPVADKKVAQEIANVIIFCELLKQLIHQESDIFFRRNWELDGVPFITTWSAGHFLQQLDAKPLVPAAAKTESKARAELGLRRKARRADKDNTTGSTRVGNVKLTTLRKSHKLNRREWKLVEAAPLHPSRGSAAPTIEEVRWKGKNKLGGRTSKHGDCDQH